MTVNTAFILCGVANATENKYLAKRRMLDRCIAVTDHSVDDIRASRMRNSISDVRAQFGRKTIDLTVFHGSDRLFTEFEFDQNPKAKRSPGVWFAADESYCNMHGQFIYECRIQTDLARWVEDFNILTMSEARAEGIDCQIALHGEGIEDAIITCNDLRKIEIVRVFDPELESYIEFLDIEDRMAEMAPKTSPHRQLGMAI
jgi:hypothetical protein